ncbi:MAG: hypothetical protein RLZZ162_733, partial [Verrucomicrobiota bacterium]
LFQWEMTTARIATQHVCWAFVSEVPAELR